MNGEYFNITIAKTVRIFCTRKKIVRKLYFVINSYLVGIDCWMVDTSDNKTK